VAIDDVLSDIVVEMVRNNQVELGISFEPANLLDLSFYPLYDDRFIAILPKITLWKSKRQFLGERF